MPKTKMAAAARSSAIAKPVGANTWDGGWIYNPEKKKTYDVELTPLDDNRLRVKGYAGREVPVEDDDLDACTCRTHSLPREVRAAGRSDP